MQKNTPKCRFGVVLGNQVLPTGEPSNRLKARLNEAIELYKAQKVDTLIVSGGIGVEGFDEADVMKQYLVKMGIPATVIFTDNQGNTTYLTAKNCATILQNNKSQRVVVISQFYHVLRCKLIFQKLGFSEVYMAAPSYFEWRDIYSLLREAVGIWVYLRK